MYAIFSHKTKKKKQKKTPKEQKIKKKIYVLSKNAL